ncbi:toxin VasX [Marinomonas sp. PE14-40]|uniref:toxin VasX n=1 Tax=Marinomonas sp. PE14-40 TaxID=3060621 RepID=UPI003F671C8A
MSNKLTSGSACEGDKFLIEVTGIGHSEEQGFDFFDLSDMEHQEALGNKKAIDPELEESTIYSWDWEEETEKRNVWLKVSAGSGVIELPLFEGVDKVSRKEKRQDYQLYATIPLTILPSFNKDISEKERLAPLRDGYLYVFYNDLAWREIKVSVLEEEMTFNDVDLYQYRESKDTAFTSDDRIPTGDNLKDIWLPSRNKNSNTNIRIAFSDVQWSAERLNFLEANISEMRKRCVSLHSLKIDREEGLLAADTLAEMRLRELQVEMICAEPRCINQDLSGNYIQDLYKTVKSDIDNARKNGDKAEAIYYPQDRPYQFDFSLQMSALSSLLGSENLEEDTWQALGSSQDYLADAKTRKLTCFALDDKIFDLKHNALLVTSGAGYFQQILIDIGQQEHFKSAELVQRFVMPEEFAGKKNPFYEHIEKDLTKDYSKARVANRGIDPSKVIEVEKSVSDLSKTYYDKAAPFQRTIRTIERLQCRKDVRILQLALEKQMNDKSLALVLKDAVSLNGLDSIVAYQWTSLGLCSLNINLDKQDSLCIEKKEDNPCFNTARRVLSSKSHPLNPVIILPESEALLEKSYDKKTPFNDGSGLTNEEKLAQWADKDLTIEDDKLQSVDLAFMTKSNSNEEGIFGTVRRSAHVISGVFQGFFETAVELNDLMAKIAKEAISIEFNTAYASALALARAADPKTLGEMIYTSFDGKREMKGVLVGVEGHGLKHGLLESEKQHVEKQSKNNKAKGSLFNKEGNLVAATNKKKAVKGNVTSVKSYLKGVFLPEKSKLLEAYDKIATKRALTDMHKDTKFGVTASNAYSKLRIPYFITIVEILNLKTNLIHLSNYMDGKDKAYSLAYIFSALVDLGVALTHASNMATQDAGRIAQYSNKTALNIPKGARNLAAKVITSAKMESSLSYIKFAGIAAGIITAAIAVWDTIRLLDAGDNDAGMAMAIVALGTGMSSLAGLFTAASPILGFGPIAWLGFALAIGGGLLYLYLKDSAVEIWLKNGPFGPEESDEYRHLKDPEIAVSKFINLIMNVSIQVYNVKKENPLSNEQKQIVKTWDASHVLFVKSNLAQFLDATSLETKLHIRQAIIKVADKISPKSGMKTREVVTIDKTDKKDANILFEEHTNEGVYYYLKNNFNMPKNGFESAGFFAASSDYVRYYPSFDSRLQFKDGDMVFPNGDIKEDELSETVDTALFNDKDKNWYKNNIEHSF